jgi:hypothetical protein
MHNGIIAAVGFALALGGCANLLPRAATAPQKGEGVEITKQQDGRFIAFVSPRLQHSEPYLGVAGTNFFALRSWYDAKTGETAHQVYVSDSYQGGPYRWDGVHDLDKKTLRFVAIGRNEITCESGCSYFDEFAAALPEDYLKAHTGGVALTFTSKTGKSLAVAVPGELVREQLAAVDTIRAAAPHASTGPSAATAGPVAAAGPAAPATAK